MLSKPAAARMRGISLVEIAVTLVILALAMAAALPSIGEWLRDLQIRSTAEALKAGIERARVEALRSNTPIGLWLVDDEAGALTDNCVRSETGPSYVIAGADPQGACAAAPSRTELPRLVASWSAAEASTSVQLRTLTAGGGSGDRIQFDTLGRLLAGDDQIIRIDVSHQGGQARALRLLVQAGGAIRLCDPSVSAGDLRAC